MSRAADVAHAEQQIQALENEVGNLVRQWQTYHDEVTEAVKERLVAAGLWDEIHGMEAEREQVRLKIDGRIQNIRQQQADLVKVRDFLKSREVAERAAPVTPPAPPAAPTPEVVPEVVPEAAPEVVPEAAPEVVPEATPEATPEVAPEVTPEATPEVASEVAPVEKMAEVVPLKAPRPRPAPPV